VMVVDTVEGHALRDFVALSDIDAAVFDLLVTINLSLNR